MKIFIKETKISDNPEDYSDGHTAPGKDEPAMYDVSEYFPDMYNSNAYTQYSMYGLDDRDVINTIKAVYKKPNARVKIYRAVPDYNYELDKQIKELQQILSYRDKFGFFPMRNKIVHEIEYQINNDNPSIDYDDMINEIIKTINDKINKLSVQKEKKIKINNGDWVTTSLLYAKQHGESNLNKKYKIVSKTVKASQLNTEGNSIFEWGYNE